MKINKAQLEEAVREACSKYKLKQEHRAKLEELLREKISAVFESAQSGGTRGSGAEGQKDPEYRLNKYDRSSNPGTNKKTKRMYNKKNRQAAKKELDEASPSGGDYGERRFGQPEWKELIHFVKSGPFPSVTSQYEALVNRGVSATASVKHLVMQALKVAPKSGIRMGSGDPNIGKVIAQLQKDIAMDAGTLREASPPGREEQVKTLKGELPATYKDKETGETKESNPWAVAWSQYKKGEK